MQDYIIKRHEVTKRLPTGRVALFDIRDTTSDFKSIEEVFGHNSYQRYKMPVTDYERWLDLGSNIGAFSVMAGHLGVKVVAVEADPTNAERTAHNIAINGLDVKVIHGAVMPDTYDKTTITLHRSMAPKSLRRHTIYPSPRRTDQILVPAMPITKLCNDYKIDAIKMNIEGAEIDILKVWSPPVRIKRIIAEWSFDKDPKIATLEMVLARLRKHFPRVVINRKWKPDLVEWKYFPPNAFIYASF